MIAGVQPNDEVIIPTLTFIAPVNAIHYCNAFPVFMDADEFYNINPEKTIEFILNETIFKNGATFNKVSERKISAIIPVHVFGNAVNLDDLYSICENRNIKIVEDATESLGTFYTKGKFAGKHTGTIGNLGCISFNGNKIITTGGGGMILTNNAEYAQHAKYLTTQAKDDEINYIHNDIGFNYRLTNVQAAIGVAQLEQLPSYLKIKKQNFDYYKNKIDSIDGLKLNETPQYADNNHWMYALQISENQYGENRDELLKKMSENNIQTRPVWYPNHIQRPYLNELNYKIEKAMLLYKRTLNIPCSANLTSDNINRIVELLKNG
jgi:dTDP-4-amino-4,6-dideoxygalactose transaminase